MCDTTHLYVWLDWFTCVTWLIHLCDWPVHMCVVFHHTCNMTISNVWHDPLINVTWLMHTCDMTHSCVWHEPAIHVISPIYRYGMTLIERTPPPRGGFLFTVFPYQEPCVRGPPSKNLVQILRGGGSYTRFLIIRQEAVYSYPTWLMWHDSFMCVTWLIHVCDMTQPYI